MATHEELITELPKLDKLSNAARLKHAKKRRLKQLKRYQEYVRQQRALASTPSVGGAGGGGNIMRRRSVARIAFEDGSILSDMVSRNELLEVRKLLEKGVDPNICNADGLTPLHKCCIDNTVEMARILLDFGADLNARDVEGWTPLHAAAATGNLHMINLLLDEGASLTAINLDDKMPVDVSADPDIKYILQQKMLEAGFTDDVLEYIRVSVPKNMLADLKDSVKQGRSLNVQDKYGSTALHVAAANGYMDVINFLLSQDNINLDAQDTEGWTPFHAAVCWEQQEAMRLLAEKGSSMDIKNLHGETPYAIAEEPEIREYILQLKSEFGQAADKAMEEAEAEKSEELGPRTRRLSVRRMRQADKNNMMRDSIKEEAMLRRESMVQQDHDRGLMMATRQESSDVLLMGDEDGPVELTSIRSLATGDSIDITSESRASVSSPTAGSEDRKAEKSLAADAPSSPIDKISGERDVERGGEGEEDQVREDSDEEKSLMKRRGQPTIQEVQRPEALEIDDPLSPATKEPPGRNPRKSVLRKKDPTPIHTGPTYTSTSPLGDPYDSSGKRRSSTSVGRECCSIM